MTALQSQGWHPSESALHARLLPPSLLPTHDNPTSPLLTPHAATLLARCPLLAVGTLDAQGRPWTSLWGGEAGFAVGVGGGLVGVRVGVDGVGDGVVGALAGEDGGGDGSGGVEKGKMMSGLGIDLDARRRVKLFGRVLAGRVVVPSLSEEASQGHATDTSQACLQLILQITQSLGNCPKYINRRVITLAPSKARIVSESADLCTEAVDLVRKADTFFVSTAHGDEDMDTNHRGGAPGFVRVSAPDDDGNDDGNDDDGPLKAWEIVWPEYSGNRLYQTLGNLAHTPKAGLVFPDFETGNVLYVSGSTRTLIGKEAGAVIPRSSLAVVLSVEKARFVKCGLGFRGQRGEPSPYNPRVRPLAGEIASSGRAGLDSDSAAAVKNTAKLLGQEKLTPTISRFTFSMSNPSASTYTPGQWIALDFSEELDEGYSHMRDDDPQSINDDFVRTFTVSSPPPPRDGKLADDEIEITVRRVGIVTGWLGRQVGGRGIEFPVKGFGGSFAVKQDDDGYTPFVAGGVGVTPLLACLPSLDVQKLRLFWTMTVDDVRLGLDVLNRHPELSGVTTIFLTGSASAQEKKAALQGIRSLGAQLEARRLTQQDLLIYGVSRRWYCCAGTGLRNTLLGWLDGKEVVYEDFNF